MSVTAPQGFRAAGVAAGLKASPATRTWPSSSTTARATAAAAVFTVQPREGRPRPVVRAGHQGRRVDAVVLNSGGANACTGPEGFQDTHATAEKAAEALGVSAGDVAVCSTGLIGERLPMDKLLAGVGAAAAALAADGGADGRRRAS